MEMAEEKKEEEGGAPAWMATFADMSILLMCFFVLLLSFSSMDVQNFREALGSVKEALGVQFEVSGEFRSMSTSPVELSDIPSTLKMQLADPVSGVMRKMKKHLEDSGLEGKISIFS